MHARELYKGHMLFRKATQVLYQHFFLNEIRIYSIRNSQEALPEVRLRVLFRGICCIYTHMHRHTFVDACTGSDAKCIPYHRPHFLKFEKQCMHLYPHLHRIIFTHISLENGDCYPHYT